MVKGMTREEIMALVQEASQAVVFFSNLVAKYSAEGKEDILANVATGYKVALEMHAKANEFSKTLKGS